MAIILEEIYEVALHRYNMKLVAGGRGLRNLVDWVHTVEEMDYVSFLKGRELIVTTGIREKDEETLVRFVKSLHETGASGLVINIGKYITRVPRGVIATVKKQDSLSLHYRGEVHLVDFNRDLCNLIYKTMRSRTDWKRHSRKQLFHKEEQQYMPVLHENHIHKDTEFFMIQCYFPANKDIQADDKFDNTQFFYRFIRQCQQIFAEKKVLSVIFQRDLYITLVAKMPTGTERENVIQQIKTFSESFARQKELYMAVGDEETVVENLWEKYRDLSYLCRWEDKKAKISVRKKNSA